MKQDDQDRITARQGTSYERVVSDAHNEEVTASPGRSSVHAHAEDQTQPTIQQRRAIGRGLTVWASYTAAEILTMGVIKVNHFFDRLRAAHDNDPIRAVQLSLAG